MNKNLTEIVFILDRSGSMSGLELSLIHILTTSQIIAYLKSHDITAERKTIYSDIEALRDFGLDIIQVSEGNNHGYYIASRDFELPELKLLVDSVQSSKFITHKKTLSLIKKIEKLASIHSAQLLNRQVFVKNRIKTMNEMCIRDSS